MDALTNYKLGSLFDGSGGFPLAGCFCGVTPSWASEVEPYPIAVTRERFPNMKHLGDISKINGGEVEPVDILTFGSPCQDLSVAGKRAGIKHEVNGDEETTRSGLFMEAVRIIKEMREATNGMYPRFALWENVPGAFSSNKGEDFRIVLEELIKVVEPSAIMPEVPKKGWAYADSYIGDGWSIAYRVFDAQYWGVPQRRRRIHLVADFRGERAREVLFEREGVRGYFAEGRTPWQAAPADAQGSTGANDREGEGFDGAGGRGLDAVGVDLYNQAVTGDKAMTLRAAAGTSDTTPCVIAIDKESFSSGEGFDRKPGIAIGGPCATLQASGTPHAVCYEWHNQDTRITGPIDTAYTLNTNAGGREGHLVVEPMVMEPFCKSARGKFKGDAETWIDGKVANTLNTFDTGEARANELVVQEDPVYCLQGNGIDRADTAGCNGKGWKEDTSYTLNTIDRPAVAYMASGEDVTGTLCSGPAMRGFSGNQEIVTGAYHVIENHPPRYIVRRLTPTECARLQGFADRWGDLEEKKTLTPEEYEFWLEVRKTHAAINGRKVQDYTEKQMLTWFNKLHADSAEYKMWGNGIALPPALYCMQGMVDALNAEENIDDWMM